MKIKFGAIVTDGRNKIGGHVASKNKAGNYLKTKSTPTNPNTSFQSSVRQNFGSLAQSWRGLTQAQRDSWIAGAKKFPYTDIFGDSKILSGFSLYMQLNSNLNSVGAALLTTCPAPASVSAASLVEVLFSEVGELSFDFLPAPVPTGHSMVCSSTPSLALGKAYSKSQIRQLAHFPATTTSTQDVGADFISRFGPIPSIANITVGVHNVLLSTGQVSPIALMRAVHT